MRLYKENTDYCFVVVNETTGIKILTDEFTDVIYTYDNGSVSADSADEKSPAILSFDYTLHDASNYTDEELSSKEFKTKLGDILMSILYNKIGEDNGIESSDFEELTLQ